MADDSAAAILAGIRELIGARDELVARMQPGRSYGAAEFNAAQDRLAERVPALLAAIEAVLALTEGPMGLEGRRLPADGQAVRNAVRKAITSELTKGETPGINHDERCCMTGNPPGSGPHPDCPGYPYWPDEKGDPDA
jgi:hypothetical protein